jgi:hypothetical protein
LNRINEKQKMKKIILNGIKVIVLFAIITVAFGGCTKKDTIPELTTADATLITSTTAISGGSITNSGGGDLLAVGICWNTAQNPTIENSKATDPYGQGLYTLTMNGLTPNTVYYVRAFATTPVGTGYGNEVSFTTLN